MPRAAVSIVLSEQEEADLRSVVRAPTSRQQAV